jgi:hypothetical protein
LIKLRETLCGGFHDPFALTSTLWNKHFEAHRDKMSSVIQLCPAQVFCSGAEDLLSFADATPHHVDGNG